MTPLRDYPLSEIQNYPDWAKRCLKNYVNTGNLYQVFQVSQALMIFESLWAMGLAPSEQWLKQKAISSLYTLGQITKEKNLSKQTKFDNELLAQLLVIREFFVINDCFDPNYCSTDITRIWIEPEHDANFYLKKLHTPDDLFGS